MNILGAGKRKYRSREVISRRPATSYRNPKIFNRKLKPPRKRLQLAISGRMIGNVVIALVILTGIILIFFSSYFKISDVMVEGVQTINADDLKTFITKGQNLILFKTEPVKEAIMRKYPQIKDIAILKGLPNAVKIQIIERQGRLVWLSDGKRYLIDSEGVATREVSETESMGIPVVADQKNIPVTSNQLLLSPDFIAFVDYINQHLYETTNLKPTGFFVEETTYDLSVTTDANIKLMFETVRSPQSQLENLKKILANFRDKITEYIDLRVEDWAYYK